MVFFRKSSEFKKYKDNVVFCDKCKIKNEKFRQLEKQSNLEALFDSWIILGVIILTTILTLGYIYLT